MSAFFGPFLATAPPLFGRPSASAAHPPPTTTTTTTMAGRRRVSLWRPARARPAACARRRG
eukprot:2389018-Prymnesium_polylepis.1